MEELNRKTLVQLLKSYNNYIQEANEEDRYGDDGFLYVSWNIIIMSFRRV